MRKLLIGTVILFFTVLLVSCKPSMIEVSFNTHGGTEVESIEVKKGFIIDLPFVEKEGHHLDGWYYDSNYQRPFDNKITNSTTIHAKWQLKSYEITYVRLEDTLKQQHVYGDEIMSPPITSYLTDVVAGWFYDEEYQEEVFFPLDMPAYDVIIYAQVVDKMTLIESLSERLFNEESFFALRMITSNLGNDQTFRLDTFEFSQGSYLLSIFDNHQGLMYYASLRDDTSYLYDSAQDTCTTSPNHPSFLDHNDFYQKAMTISHMLKDMSLFEYVNHQIVLKEVHELNFSNLYYDEDNDVSKIDDFRVSIRYDMYFKLQIDVQFNDLFEDAVVEYTFNAVGTHEINMDQTGSCRIFLS